MKAVVAGVGMVPFAKPRLADPYHVMGSSAVWLALADAGLSYDLVQQAFVGYVYGDSTSGQAAIYPVGLTGIPVFNVNNNCASGSSALFLARQAIESGAADCVLALGFEQMPAGALARHFLDRPDPLERFKQAVAASDGWDESIPFAPQFFGLAGRRHSQLYGTRPSTFAKIAVKARRHAAANPNAVFRDLVTEEEVLSSPRVFGDLTRLQCCPPTCGAAAAIICSPDFAHAHSVEAPVTIVAQAMTTDRMETFTSGDPMSVVGYGMTREAANKVYEQAGVGPADVSVVELHDCFTVNELISYEALELTPEGTAERFVVDGQNTYGGQVVVNPSGGLLSKGHPLGATGLAQCAELVWQLRGRADKRQVEGARLALQHNVGLGGACVVTLYAAAG